jgi:hypothetical protein
MLLTLRTPPTTIEILMLVPRGVPMMMARIGIMNALNRHVVRVFNPDAKEHHWGKRKLKLDQQRAATRGNHGSAVRECLLLVLMPRDRRDRFSDNRCLGACPSGKSWCVLCLPLLFG